MKKRILSMLLAIVMVVSMVGSFAFAAGAEDFSDVEEGKWYYDYVDRVAELGYFIGLPDGTFSPETPVNRAAMVLVLARMAQRFGVDTNVDLDAKGVETPFVDVPENEWYAAAVKWAYDNGITTGVSTTEFMPREPVTREDSCTFILRFLGYMSGKLGKTYTDNKTHRVFEFKDEANIRDYAVAAVDECMAYGIVEGTTGDETGYFYPRETWKRGEGAKMVSILHDILMNPDNQEGPSYVTHTSKLIYVVDGKEDVITVDPQPTTVLAGTDISKLSVTWTITDVATYTNENGVEYAILGWDKTPAASTVDHKAGEPFGTAVGSTVKLYAVLVPMDDYIKMAVLGAIEDANAYATKAEELTITAGSHDVTVGSYLTAEDITLDVKTNTVKVAVAGELNSSTVVDVIALATEYAVAILGPDEELPTVDEIKDIVIETADSVGVTLEGQTAEEIAKQVYDKLDAIGTDLFSNFRNYNGGFCINKITLKSGGKAVASLNVTNDKGLTTDGAEASKAAAKELAIAVAKAMYADLRTQSGSAITMKASIVVEFGTDCPGYDETKADYKGYSDTYTLDLALTLKSDMYRYDGATNTLTLIIKENLQEQYAESVEDVMIAALENGTVQAKLTELIEKALEKSGLLDSLSSLAAKDAVEAAVDLWIAANLKAEAADPVDTPYEFLWTKEGTIIALTADEYATSTGTILGDNAALYALVETVYAEKLADVIESVDAGSLSGTEIDAIKELIGKDTFAAAFANWQKANGANGKDTETAYTLYNFLFNGGKIVDNGDGTYALANLTDKKLGINDALYGLYEDLVAVATDTAMDEAEKSLGAGWANATPSEKIIVVKIAVDSVISSDEYKAFTGSIREYILNLCMAEAANELGVDASAYETEAAKYEGNAQKLMDDMLLKGLYSAVNGNEYADYVGLDQPGREDMVDQMILKALATTTVKGKTLNEYLALAYHVKTIERMATVELDVFAGLLNNTTFQNVAAQYGNEYVHYLATAITKLPAKASVTIDGVVLSEAELEAVKTAAANDDTKAVCTELAKIVSKLGHLSMNEIEADPLTVTVKYGNYSVTMNLGLIIE